MRMVANCSWIAMADPRPSLDSIFVPAYDDPIIWEGHSSMIARQLPNKVKPDAIFCSVGGGGLCAGVMLGCRSVGWDDGRPEI